MQRRLVVASAIAVVAAAALLPGSGLGSSAAAVRGGREIPAGLVAAIHARLGAGAIRSSLASRVSAKPPFLGSSVAISADGTTALVGAPGVDGNRGAAYVFHVSGAGAWSSRKTSTAALTHTGGGRESFGYTVALSADGTTAFVGAPDAGGDWPNPGAIYAFHVSAEDAWTSSSTPTATLTVTGGFVGLAFALSTDGTTLVAGAPFYDIGQAGGAYVFHVSSEDAWASTATPTATLSNANESRLDYDVGWEVAVSADGTTALLSDDSNPHGGGAYIYHAAAEDAWASSSTPTAILTDVNSFSGDDLGNDVALSADGTVAVLGFISHYAADVYRASGEAAWASTSTPAATLTNGAGSYDDYFGTTVAVSADGTTALVTGFIGSSVLRVYRGAAYIFRVADEGAWASSSMPAAALTDSRGHADDLSPGALTADGATALLGAPDVRFRTGAADVFHVSEASSWASSSTPTAILTDSALDQCVVPKLKGLTVRGAKSALKARGCRLGKVTSVHAKAKKGRVVSQSHTPGSRLPVGAKVAVIIEK